MVWKIDDPQGNEMGKIAHRVVPYAMGKHGVDIGCGPQKIFSTAVGVDNCKDTELFNIPMDPDINSDVCDMPFKDESFDWAFSSHVLEHIENPEVALNEWMRVIKPGGYLVLYLPHRDLYPNIGEEGSNPDHKHDFTNEDVSDLMGKIPFGWTLLEDEVRGDKTEYSFFQVYRKERQDGLRVYEARDWSVGEDGSRVKTVCVVRYGGFGDVLQAACVLPQLKEQGYHISFMTTPRGQDVLEGNPYIDRFILQGPGQVPEQQLPGYWKAWQPDFDKWVNLSESVEGSLLTVPGRANHLWPDNLRRKRCDVNYAEFVADIAEVEFEQNQVFYPTEQETIEAKELVDGKPTVLWALSGSSQHKFYPGMDNVIAQIMLETDMQVITVGDEACKILEAGWEKEDRVICLSGELSIRQTLALAQQVDVVVGPETGVLNSVGHHDSVGKVCLLSHSSHENLTKHWKNSMSISPEGVSCYPCHRLHYTMEFCHEDKDTGSAICQFAISPETVFKGIKKASHRSLVMKSIGMLA